MARQCDSRETRTTSEGSRTFQESFKEKGEQQRRTHKARRQLLPRNREKRRKGDRHKLAPIAQGPFPVTEIDKVAKTVAIERPDRSAERVSRSRLLLAPITNPISITDIIRD